jgi:CubicO group peptidase (beta-lactamase class C family)
MRWPTLSSGVALIGLLACERAPEPSPAPDSKPELPELAVPAELPEAARKRECVDRLLATAEPRFHALLRSLCAEWVNQAIPGLAVAVIEDDVLRLHVELGVRCVGQQAPVDARTAFRIGSISKTFTASLALETFPVAALTAPVSLPGLVWPAGMPTPTLDALLRHRSGLGEIAPEHIVAFAGEWKPALAHGPAAGQPGEWHYSNAGYVIVGALLEAKTGQSYQELLHMRVAGFPTITADPASPDAACGHLRQVDGLRAIPVEQDLDFMPGDPSWMYPSGGVLSSAEDLARFGARLDARMLVPGDPLPREAWRHGGNDERYGLGLRSWVIGSGTRVFGHSGDTGSFAAELVVAPDRRIAIALLANAPTSWTGPRVAIHELLAEPRP